MSAPSPPSPPALKPEEFQILLALEDADRHGYAVLKRIEAVTGGTMVMAPSPFYRRLKRLAAAGLLNEADERPAPELDDERRRYYTLTELGRTALQREADRLVALASRDQVIALAQAARTRRA